jgi:hypothetical protein
VGTMFIVALVWTVVGAVTALLYGVPNGSKVESKVTCDAHSFSSLVALLDQGVLVLLREAVEPLGTHHAKSRRNHTLGITWLSTFLHNQDPLQK